MAGGSGERFWPWSRTQKPKHLLRLFSNRTLLEETVLRCRLALPNAPLLILSNQLQTEAIRREAPELNQIPIVSEPVKRDTAPAAALATALARQKDGDSAIAVLTPADARITNTQAFSKDMCDLVEAAAQQSAIVTLGIPPKSPATGFGYLKLGERRHGRAVELKKFVEKPDAATAVKFLNEGSYLWNAGIFAWQAGAFLAEARRQQPLLAEFIENFPAENQESYINENFPRLPKISVDYAICENATTVLCVPATFDWDDVGSWPALKSHRASDANGNTIIGECVLLDCQNNVVVGGERLISACGLRDIVIADTPDALLVCPLDQIHRLKEIVSLVPDHLK